MKMIRIKEKEDCASWVDVNINSWNDHLKGIVSDKLLNFMKDNKEARIKKEEETFVRDDYHYVLEDNKKIVGIMKLKDSEREGFENAGEVQMLYLNSDEKGKGYGALFIQKAKLVFKEKGYTKMVIGCLSGNPSNKFYVHMGGEFVRQDPWDVFDEHYMENVYEYDLTK